MSISKVSSASEALFAFRMSLAWLKNLSTEVLERTGVMNLTKSLERSSHQLYSICLSTDACVMVPNPPASCFFSQLLVKIDL
jgi:hypothetical protein